MSVVDTTAALLFSAASRLLPPLGDDPMANAVSSNEVVNTKAMTLASRARIGWKLDFSALPPSAQPHLTHFTVNMLIHFLTRSLPRTYPLTPSQVHHARYFRSSAGRQDALFL
ncbi:uncharacterized protein J3D65DRAFT_605182 [Phyllosticta citribraziliensis]|uniref:Uncharacterized protein n=1 Tax=Phyllosticta citribraziliensis TaxID=989973 RepID=A0ABR1LG45_9PEZI